MGKVKIKNRPPSEFLSGYNISNRSLMFNEVSTVVRNFGYLSRQDQVFVLRMCIHKIKECDIG